MKEDNKSAGPIPEGNKEKLINLIKELDTKFGINQKNLSDYLMAKGLRYSEAYISKLKKGEGSDFQYDAIFEQVDHLKKELEPFYPSRLNEGFKAILAREKEARRAMTKDEHQVEGSDLPEEENGGESSGMKKQLNPTSEKKNLAKQEPQGMSRLFKILVGILFLWLFSLSVFLFFQWQNRPAEQKTILLSPQGGENSPWVDSGIEVAPGDEIKIEASGKINLAFHHMLEAAIGDTLPTHAWTGPQGELERDILKRLRNKYNSKSSSTAQKQAMLEEEIAILRDRNEKRLGGKIPSRWGEILWCIAQEEPKGVPDYLDIETYSNGIKRGSNKCKSRGRLFLSVNDIWLYNHNDYLDEAQYETLHLTVEKIKELKKCGYYNLWFDDNVGAFLVTVTKK